MHVQKLKTSGSIITDPFNILSEQKRFYQELYTSQDKKADNTRATECFLNNLNIPGLTEQQKLSCEGEITSNECTNILGNPGATNRDDAIFLSERYFRAKVYFKC